MKFLLTGVNAKYIHSNPAIYSLRAYANAYKEHIEIAEYTINQRQEEILADIFKRKPNVIAFSCYIWNWTMIQNILKELPKLLPQTHIWLGGPEVSYDAEKLLKQFSQIAGIMVGEGEQTFLELMSHYIEKQPNINNIKGIMTKENKYVPRALTDLNSIPFLYDDIEAFENKIIYYESSRGCPFSCSYCLSSIDKSVRLRDMDTVKKELQIFLDKRVPQVKFIDRTFNFNHKHTSEIWKYLKENDNGVTNFHFEISADILSEEELSILNSLRAGLVQLEIGVQSVNETTIREINRTMHMQNLRDAVCKIKIGKNVHIHLDLIAGLPYEDYSSFKQSFNEVYSMEPEQLQLGFLKVLKGSVMQHKAERYGMSYTDMPPYEVLFTKWLSYEHVLKLKRVEEMVELYYNSGQFQHTLHALITLWQTPFLFFEQLSQYYEKHQFFINSPSRAYRYHILYEFLMEKVAEKKELLQELLTYDMYVRENLKSRPDFAKDLSCYKNNIYDFYKTEEEKKSYLQGYATYNYKQLSKMTHMDVFFYPVWESETSHICQKQHKPHYVLFDYAKRNPLNAEAQTYVVMNEAMT